MSKCALFAMAGFLGLSVTLSAQELGPMRFNLNQAISNGLMQAPFSYGQTRFFGSLNNAWCEPSALTLSDGRLFSFPGSFAWMEAAPANYIQATTLAAPPRVTPSATLARNSESKPVDLLPRIDYIGGEVGGFYGKSTGKSGLEVKGGYIMSEIIEGNTHITVGASYEESSGRFPRFGR